MLMQLCKRLSAVLLFGTIFFLSLCADAQAVRPFHVTPAGGILGQVLRDRFGNEILDPKTGQRKIYDGTTWELAVQSIQTAAEYAGGTVPALPAGLTQAERDRIVNGAGGRLVHASLGDYGQVYRMNARTAGVTVLGAFNRNSNNRVMPDYIQYTTMFSWVTTAPGDVAFLDANIDALNNYWPRILDPYADPTMNPTVRPGFEGDNAVIRQLVDYPANLVSTFDGFWIQNPGGKDNNMGWSQHGVILRMNGVVSNSWISNCEAHFGAGAVLEGGGTLDKCNIFNNVGRVSFLHFRENNNAVHPDKWAGRGAAVYTYSGGVINDCKLYNNTVQNGNFGRHSPGSFSWGMGGAVYVDDAIDVFGKPLPVNPDPNYDPVDWQHITNTVIDKNTSEHWGGGVEVIGEYPLYVDSCLFSNNQAAVWGGGLDLTIATDNPQSFFFNTVFKANTAPQGAGAYIANTNTFERCTFTENVALGQGGGAYISGHSAFDSCLLIKNQAEQGGGVYYRIGSGEDKFWTINTVFRENTATSGGGLYAHEGGVFLSNGTLFDGNTAVDGGGVAAWFTFSAENTAFRNNIATNGGGLWTKFGGLVKSCIFEGNTGNQNGGGIFGSDGTNVHASYIANNIANGNGGGIFTNSDTVYISSSVIVSNFSTNNGGGVYCDRGGTITNCTIVNNLAQNNGGGLFVNQNARVFNNVLWNNNGANEYPQIYVQNGQVNYNAVMGGVNTNTNIGLADSNYDPKGPQFLNPSPNIGSDPNWMTYARPFEVQGGWNVSDTSILINAGLNRAVPNIDDVIQYKAITDILGRARIIAERVDIGAYENQDSTVVLYVIPGGSGSKDGYSWRNAMDNIQDAVDTLMSREVPPAPQKPIRGLVRVGTPDNVSVFEGAPYYMRDGVHVEGSWSASLYYQDSSRFLTILDGGGAQQILRGERPFANSSVWSEFIFRNGLSDNGGAATLAQGCVVSNSLFTQNKASANGGAAILNGGEIFNCRAEKNSALHGGAFYMTDLGGSISRTEASYNTASGNGGAIHAFAGEVEHVAASFNTAVNGGGIYVAPSGSTRTTPVTLSHCDLNGNTASGSGGGLYFNAIDQSAQYITAQFNRAVTGGGIHFVEGLIRYAKVGSNSAVNGGGVSASTTTDSGRIDNSLIANNTASANGGGYYSSNGTGRSFTPLMANCTIVSNNAGGQGLGVYNSGTTYSTVIWNNTDLTGMLGKQYEYVGAKPADQQYVNCAVYDFPEPNSCNTFDLSEINFNPEGPSFVSPNLKTGPDSNWLLYRWMPKEQSASVLVNNGMPRYASGIDSDLAGNARVVATRVDIGAYESQFARLVLYVDESRTSGSFDGYSWRNASQDINQTIQRVKAVGGGEVHLRAGLYGGTSSFTNNRQVVLIEDVSLYGGYLADGITRDSYSIIDADFSGRPLTQKVDFAIPTVVDGLQLQNGVSNEGGGAYMRMNGLMNNCIISGNSATRRGGGLVAENTQVTNIIAANNNAKEVNLGDAYGGGIVLDSAVVTNALVVNNAADQTAGIYASGASKMINSTVAANLAGSVSGGVRTAASSLVGAVPALYNTLIWGNKVGSAASQTAFAPGTLTQYCAVESMPGQWIVLDPSNAALLGPKFVEPSLSAGLNSDWRDFNWHLLPGSRCVDFGNNAYYPSAVRFDVMGDTRIFPEKGGVVDIGALETVYGRLTVNLTAIGQTRPVKTTTTRYEVGQIVDANAENLGRGYTFSHWSGDVKLIVSGNITSPKIKVKLQAGIFTLQANYVYDDVIIVGPGVVVPVYPNASESNGSTGGSFEPGLGGNKPVYSFTRGTQLYAKGLIDGRLRKYKLTIITPLPADQMEAVLNAKVPLYSKKALKECYADGGTVAGNTQLQKSKQLSLYYKLPGGTETAAHPNTIVVNPPELYSTNKAVSSSDPAIVGKPNNETVRPNIPTVDNTRIPSPVLPVVTPQTDTFYVLLEASKPTIVEGDGFGQKLPKAWLEYKKERGGKTLKYNVKVEKYYAFPDAKGKAAKSCTDTKTGLSKIKLTGPKINPNIPEGFYVLVLDNGSGLATISVYYKPQPSGQ